MKCIFLTTEPQICEARQLQFQINLLKLDESRLFVANFELIDDLLHGMVRAIQNNNVDDIPIEKIKLYWNSICPYTFYQLKDNPQDVEIMYFGHIPPDPIAQFSHKFLYTT
ncbi:hypothetical protein SMD22_01045 (plasmid) [Brevibacillus halotolerans]|nr:hypothetical protein SMD22_01045 [Brevibacillus halotolerans]